MEAKNRKDEKENTSVINFFLIIIHHFSIMQIMIKAYFGNVIGFICFCHKGRKFLNYFLERTWPDLLPMEQWKGTQFNKLRIGPIYMELAEVLSTIRNETICVVHSFGNSSYNMLAEVLSTFITVIRRRFIPVNPN